MKKLDSYSRFLSFVLRHHPEALDLELDSQGWVSIDELLANMTKRGTLLTKEMLQTIVETNDKKRFSISDSGTHIRAAQGHSTKTVNISFDEKTPPEILFHGTASRFLESIKKRGLIAGSRHYVHLSSDIETARTVGLRYGLPVVLKVQALTMHEKGYKFYQSDNGVWLSKNIPKKFLVF